MLRPRIIPCLLLRDGGLVKTVQFDDPKYVGDPINAVRIFNEKEVDELIVIDIDATVQRREPNYRLIAQFAAECRMPLCYGGGVKTTEQAKLISGLGVEKIAISSAAIENLGLIAKIAGEIGSQSVVVVLDVRRKGAGGVPEVFTHNGLRATGKTPESFARVVAEQGAGEIVINCIDDDGVMKGYDVKLAQRMRAVTRLPMTYLGGAGSLADMGELISECGIIGASAGSLFVFKGPYRAVLISYPTLAQREELIRDFMPALS